MEIVDILTGSIVLFLVLGIGVGTLVWAYVGSGSTSVVFPQPVPLPEATEDDRVDEAIAREFLAGTEAYEAKKYDRAVENFSTCIERSGQFAQAYHNRGLALANLCRDREAAANLVKAGECYAEGNNEGGVRQIRQNLETLQARI
ncbi:MAG: hypothetical protein SWY16_06300 [Cyanobacteriota bacterium]|nr:hypothetical protein [Cyanobacteriota bacterium]